MNIENQTIEAIEPHRPVHTPPCKILTMRAAWDVTVAYTELEQPVGEFFMAVTSEREVHR